MEEKQNGIVLGGINYGENDKILNIFTLTEGTVSAKIKGVKKAGAKLKFCAEPFCFAEFIFSVSPKGRTIIGASLIDSFYPVRENIVKYFCAGTVLEFIKRFEMENIVSKELFILTIDTLKNIAYSEQNAKSVLVKFLIDALRITGYALSLKNCFNCGKELNNRIYFDCFSGAFLCSECGEKIGRKINFSTFLALKKAENNEQLSEEESTFALRLIDYYLVNKTQEKLNSLKELLKINN